MNMNVSLQSYTYVTFPQEISNYVKNVPSRSWTENIVTHDKDGSFLLLFFKALAFSSNTGPETTTNVQEQIQLVDGAHMPFFFTALCEALPAAPQVTAIRLKNSEVQSIIQEKVLRLFSVKKEKMQASLRAEFERAIQEYRQKEVGELTLQTRCEQLIQQCNSNLLPEVLRSFRKNGAFITQLDLSSCSLSGENLQKILKCFPSLEELKLANNSLTVKSIEVICCSVPLKSLDLTAVTKLTSEVMHALTSFPYRVFPLTLNQKFPFTIFFNKESVLQLLKAGHAAIVTHQVPQGIDFKERERYWNQYTEVFTRIAVKAEETYFNGKYTVKYLPHESTLEISSGNPIARKYVYAEIPSPFFELM